MTQGDFDALVFASAIEVSKGPQIPFRFGRTDGLTFEAKIPDPQNQSADELRAAFPQYDDKQIVALCG